MKIEEFRIFNVSTNGDGEKTPSTRLTPNALPERGNSYAVVESSTGVSTRYARFKKALEQETVPQWYVLRATYGREKKAYDYLVAKGVTAFYPTMNIVKVIKGKRKKVRISCLPNIFFAYGTEECIKTFVYDNVNLPFLRFYYEHIHSGNKIIKKPLIIPNSQIESFKIICSHVNMDIIIQSRLISNFQRGEKVKVVEGAFKGVEGNVARCMGQQRVGIIVGGVFTVATAYVPSSFLKRK